MMSTALPPSQLPAALLDPSAAHPEPLPPRDDGSCLFFDSPENDFRQAQECYMPQQQQQQQQQPQVCSDHTHNNHAALRTYACSLNNMGVELLRLGEFQQAVGVLDDALAVMMAQSQPPSQQQQHGQIFKFAQERLLAASMTLSSMCNCSTSSPPSCVRITAVESNDLQALTNASLAPEAASILSYSAVLIRDYHHAANTDNTAAATPIDADRESAIVLYNYGLASHLLQATTPTTNDNEQQEDEHHGDDAVSSLMYAHATFSNLLLACQDANQDLATVFLSMLTLTCTSKCLQVLGNAEGAQEAWDAARTLHQAVQEEMGAAEAAASQRGTAAAA